jgi:hypothetical protein
MVDDEFMQPLPPVSRAQGLMLHVLGLTPQALCLRLLRRLLEGPLEPSRECADKMLDRKFFVVHIARLRKHFVTWRWRG